MKEPIKAGDICEVVGGLGRNQSPNLGLRVTVGHRIFGAFGMNHTQFGPVVRCTGKGVVQLGDAGQYVETGWADFPIEWLRKIEPDAPPVESVTREAEKT